MKRQVPGREPRVLPGVGHRHDVEGLEAAPPGVAAVPPLRRRRRLARVAVEPAGHVVVVELLAPEHAGERLAHHRGFVGRCRGRGEFGVELVGLGAPLRHYPGEVRASAVAGSGPPPAGRRRSRSSAVWPGPTVSRYQAAHLVPRRSGLTVSAPGDDVVVDAVLRPSRGRRNSVEPFKIRVVVTEQQLRVGALRVRPG